MTPIYDQLCDETLVFPHNNEPETGPIPIVPNWWAVEVNHVNCD